MPKKKSGWYKSEDKWWLNKDTNEMWGVPPWLKDNKPPPQHHFFNGKWEKDVIHKPKTALQKRAAAKRQAFKKRQKQKDNWLHKYMDMKRKGMFKKPVVIVQRKPFNTSYRMNFARQNAVNRRNNLFNLRRQGKLAPPKYRIVTRK